MIPRKNIPLELPFREIRPEDASQPFFNELQPKNRIDLSFLVDKNVTSRYVFVFDLDGKILGFMTFIDMGTHFHLDLVENNQLYSETKSLKPGFQFIDLLEGVSKNFGYAMITLNSIQDRVVYYKQYHGYRITGDPFEGGDYGLLTPMQKLLI